MDAPRPAKVRALIDALDLDAAGMELGRLLASGEAWGPQDLGLVTRYVRAANAGAKFHQLEVPQQAGPPLATMSELMPAERVRAPGFKTLNDPPAAIGRVARSHTVSRPAIELWRVADASVFYVRGALIVKDAAGVTLAAGSGRGSTPLEGLYEAAARHRPAHHVPGTALLLSDSSDGGNYCHWMLDHLTRLALYRRAGVTPGSVLVATTGRPFNQETLERTSVDHLGAVDLSKHPLVTVDELFVVSSVGPSFRHPAHGAAPWALDYLDERFAPRSRPQARSRIYVSRADADGRRVVNEEEVVMALEKHGVERVVMGDLTVDEQAALFADAELVIAPHGAGLSNLAYSRPRARVLELFPTSYGTPAFAMVAQSRGLDYQTLSCPPVPVTLGRPSKDDLQVDVDAVRRWSDDAGRHSL